MKIVQINTVCGKGSTGKICVDISRVLNTYRTENYILYCSGHSDYSQGIKCSEKIFKLQALRSRLWGNYGFNSKKTTKRLIEELDRISPDVVHLHNLHGHNCNLELLMNYFRREKTKLVWTFHDCWAFTAYCPHFVMAACDKWKTGCHHCVQKKTFSCFFDRSEWLYKKKKEMFSNLDMVITTPSQWLAGLVKESFLKDYPVNIINNGIDLNIFKPIPSGFRMKYGIPEEKFILLGVAVQWVPRKGADIFSHLAEKLDPDKFQIVMVGTDEKIDMILPNNIISIHRTESQTELAEIYTAADLFVNPTREEVLGMVNLEALACGTPVVTFNTGGSPECIDEFCGSIVECNDVDALEREIHRIATDKPYSEEACLNRAKEFNTHEKFQEYVQLYENIKK